MTPRLTLNYGLRWSPGSRERYQRRRYVVQHVALPGRHQEHGVPQAPAGIYYGGDPASRLRHQQKMAECGSARGLGLGPQGRWPHDRSRFLGEFYDYPNGQTLINMTIGPPSAMRPEPVPPELIAGQSWKTVPTGNPSRFRRIPRVRCSFLRAFLSMNPQTKIPL